MYYKEAQKGSNATALTVEKVTGRVTGETPSGNSKWKLRPSSPTEATWRNRLRKLSRRN